MYPLLCCIILFIALLDTNFVTSSPKYCSKYAGYCGKLRIEYPFSLSSDNFDLCGYPGLMINSCNEDNPTINISNKSYHVTSIDKYQVLTVVGMDVLGHECPRPVTNITEMVISETSPYLSLWSNNGMTIFYNCSEYPRDVSHIACLEFNSTKRSYAFSSNVEFPKFDWYGNCETSVVVPLIPNFHFNESLSHFNDSNYNTVLQLGFQLRSVDPDYCFDCAKPGQKSGGFCFDCENSGGFCWFNQTTSHVGCKCGFIDGKCHNGLTQGLKVFFGVLTGAGGVLLILLIVCRKRLSALKTPISRLKKTIQRPTNVEVFLESYGCLSLQRYSYSDVKNMTNSFQDILGQGGYGSVFKGKLSDGRLVAVKVLKESKGNGEEFINEVATIGRTNHVNVVALLGFCSNRSKRALVYEFMPNGSLERFIYNENKSSTTGTHLGGETLYRIALGIAKGLEYLHSGCNTRILHFDIKPHNILLDENFCPKISDFGLAKLCATRESVVSMLEARGTIGYIAPEVCCRNFGGVSYKSDVYSYGMMLLEMIGGRKNIDATVVNTSEIYFPHWIYNRLKKERAVAGSEEVFMEETTKKMVLIGLWCIQIQPTTRPSMTKVVDMLEGSIEDLEMPPNPFTDPPPTPSIDLSSTSSPSVIHS